MPQSFPYYRKGSEMKPDREERDLWRKASGMPSLHRTAPLLAMVAAVLCAVPLATAQNAGGQLRVRDNVRNVTAADVGETGEGVLVVQRNTRQRPLV